MSNDLIFTYLPVLNPVHVSEYSVSAVYYTESKYKNKCQCSVHKHTFISIHVQRTLEFDFPKEEVTWSKMFQQINKQTKRVLYMITPASTGDSSRHTGIG